MRVALIMCPEWSVAFPPCNLAILKTILQEHGHVVKIFDLNVQTFYNLKKEPIDYWHGNSYFYWNHPYFKELLLPKIDFLLDLMVERIMWFKPDVVGFSIMASTLETSLVVAKRIRAVNPSIKIIVGGSSCLREDLDSRLRKIADSIVLGEGEEVVVKAVEDKENKNYKHDKAINLNDYSFPDYSDFNLDIYKRKKGLSIEGARGCVAKCSFCTETHFWPYRFKKAENIVAEIKHYIKEYGANDFRFNDSLVNGNIKEFRKLVDLLCEENLNITWDGYARINGKMDLEFLRKVKESGNILISYGIESGSQKVLDDMRKGIKVEEVEQNLKDGHEVGLFNHVNWIVGFPTEKPIDFLHSLLFINNNREYIHNIAPGMTCGVGDRAEIEKHRERFDILPGYYWDNFATKGFKNTAIHRYIRLKEFHIWLNLLEIVNGQQNNSILDHYQIEFVYKREPKRVEYNECLDFSYLNKDFKSSLYAEYLNFFWAIYKVFGEFKMRLIFDRDLDEQAFGKFITKEYDAVVKFKVDSECNWHFSLMHNLKTVEPFSETFELEGTFNG